MKGPMSTLQTNFTTQSVQRDGSSCRDRHTAVRIEPHDSYLTVESSSTQSHRPEHAGNESKTSTERRRKDASEVGD